MSETKPEVQTQTQQSILNAVRSRIDELKNSQVEFSANPDVSESLLDRAENCETWDGDNTAPNL